MGLPGSRGWDGACRLIREGVGITAVKRRGPKAGLHRGAPHRDEDLVKSAGPVGGSVVSTAVKEACVG